MKLCKGWESHWSNVQNMGRNGGERVVIKSIEIQTAMGEVTCLISLQGGSDQNHGPHGGHHVVGRNVLSLKQKPTEGGTISTLAHH